jgi:negative regulator of flagellin synthesis FlgM
MKGNAIMTIINNIMTGLARNSESNQKAPVQPPRQTLDKGKISGESPYDISLPEDVLINFSDQSKEAYSILDYIDEIPDIREEKVAALKQQFDEDTYYFDYEKIASNMVDAFLNGTV